MADVTVEQLADDMFDMVKETLGKKNLKAGDLTKAMIKKHGTDKATCKLAIRSLMESGRCVYSYFGGSFVTIPHMEASDPDRLKQG